jgi:ribose transport system permease protein
VISGKNSKIVTDTSFLLISQRRIAEIPVTFWMFFCVCVALALLLHQTNFGRLLRAVGTNETAAYMTGVAVSRTRLTSFVIVGLTVGLAAFLQTSQLASASPTVGVNYELTVIAIVVLGGTGLSGGNGTLFGTACSAVFFAVLNNLLNLYGVASYWQYIATGAVLIAALALDSGRSRMLRFIAFGSAG